MVNVPEILAPLPLAAIPVRLLVLSLVQVNEVPTIPFGLVIIMVVMGNPEQTIWLVGATLKVGTGFTLTVTIVDEEQPFAVAVTVNAVICVKLVLLVNEPEILAPDPLAGIPVRFTLLSLVQVKVVPGMPFVFEILIVLIAAPEQIV